MKKQLKNKFVFWTGIFSCALFSLSFSVYSGENFSQRFDESKVLNYSISFNGIPSGHIRWVYLGKESIAGKEVLALSIESETDILRLLNLVSSEKIYLDAKTNLPVKVERDVSLFGKKELIQEKYDQEAGKVTITRKVGEESIKEEVYRQAVPIHNILELLYFFPEDIDLKQHQGQWMSFNLPNQRVEIRFNSKRSVTVNGQRKEAYFLEGKGARRFNLWLCQENRLPLQLDFLSMIGRIRIRQEKASQKEVKL